MTDLVQRLRSVDSEYGFQLAAFAADRIEQLEKRLEINQRSGCDGIECRDETIRQLARENASNQEIMREKHRAALGFLQRIAKLEDENAELRTEVSNLRNSLSCFIDPSNTALIAELRNQK